jgi:hypothetical protein
MTTTYANQQAAADAFGRRVARRLSQGSQALPHDISERLRVGRQQALAARKKPALEPAPQLAWASAGAGPNAHGPGLWRRVATALPAVLLLAGLVAISHLHSDRRAREVAEVDAALLTDALPPAAYTDPGFLAYLRSER